jgi:hypothetical protein
MAMRARGSCRRGEAKSSPSASCGEYGRRERDELRQVPQILGGGGQKEFVFCSVWAALAQSIEPEDAFQMSEEHPDLLFAPARDHVGLGWLCYGNGSASRFAG